MSFTIGTLLDRHYNKAHANHVHVEPPTIYVGHTKDGVNTYSGKSPPTRNPGMTPGVKAIYDALEAEFGPGAYFQNPPAGTKWTHMGGYSRRPTSGSTRWSQHAWWNALDIGPYYGTDQDKFVKFLKEYSGKDDDYVKQLTDHEAKEVKMLVAALGKVKSNGSFVEWIVPDIRKGIITVDELEEALAKVNKSTTVDQFARDLAQSAHNKLKKVKDAI